MDRLPTLPGEDIRLELPHIELAARVYGPPTGQPVIALHGWLDNANSFARLAPRLPGLRIVALDFAGHGLSAHRPAGASYALWDYAQDVLLAAEHLGWKRFSLMGHSLGAIVALLLGAALPDRIERLALIDGLIPPTGTEEEGAARLGTALRARLDPRHLRKRIHPDWESAVLARRRSHLPVSLDAAQYLAQRGVQASGNGYAWRSDPRLTLPSPVRLSQAQALAYVAQVQCPSQLVLARGGVLAGREGLLEGLPVAVEHLPGGHHLHLDDEVGADAVARCFNRFFAFP
jgi:pimeloyl-ACP methyl ester carboxylesterase